jgi:Mg/Co/Ni transporter MgtE
MARRQQKTDIRIGDLPARRIPAIPDHLSMAAARKVAALKRVEVLFVEQHGRLLGALDERALAEAPDDATVAASMTPIGACLHPEMPATRARDLFAWMRVSILPVAVGVLMIGAIARADVERALATPDDVVVRARAA